MAARLIYKQFSKDRHHALAVGISRQGVHVVEVDFVGNYFDTPPPALFLARKAVFSWRDFWTRERCYSGDDGSGCMRQRIVSGAVSLIAQYGGVDDWLNEPRDLILP